MSVVESLAAIKDQLVKARSEIVEKIDSLEEAVGEAGQPTPEVVAALEDLRGVAQSLDDVVADAPVELVEPVEPVEPVAVVEDEASEPVDPVE